jgi:hypothetical protein
VARVAREIAAYLDWAGSSFDADEFAAAAADLFRAIYGRDPDADESPSREVWAAVQTGLTAPEAKRAKRVLARLW